MQIAGVVYCALRRCEDRAVRLISDVALCQAHSDLLTSELTPPAPLFPFREVVYYASWQDSDQVKIGTSTRLRPRMHALSSGMKGRAHLLVVEPGSYSIERRRHREFRSLRIQGTELFRLTPQIDAHVTALRGQWPQWLEQSGVGAEWLP